MTDFRKWFVSIAVATLFAAASLTGCAQRPSKVSSDIAQAMTDKLTYTKDHRVNQCFATVASRTFSSVHQNGFTITWVPCTPEVETQIGKK